jgi:hypothetical protein
MGFVITTAFITHCYKNKWLSSGLHWLCVLIFVLMSGVCHAQIATEITQYQVERSDDEILVSAQVAFELPSAIEEALLKGIPMVFVTEASVLRERWYWYDKKLASAQRHMRLAYQPLTRRWRLNVTAGPGREASVGLTLNPSFDTLEDALSAIKRLSRWKVADASSLEVGVKYKVDFGFKLDLSQLPRPFQIGALGQSDWDLAATSSTTLTLATVK